MFKVRKFSTIKTINTFSYSFSGAGWLTPFHLGVIHGLRELNLLSSSSIVAGSSGGSIAAVLCSTNLNELESLEGFKLSIKDTQPMKNIDSNLRIMLKKMLPEDAYLKCNDHCFITITPIKPPHKTILISNFTSNQDLIDCIATSCFIPGYSAKKLTTKFRNEKYIDGGILAFLPSVGEITINPLPQIGKYMLNPRRSIIHPLLVPEFNVPLSKMIKWAFIPVSPEKLDYLFEIGYKASKIWGNKQFETEKEITLKKIKIEQ